MNAAFIVFFTGLICAALASEGSPLLTAILSMLDKDTSISLDTCLQIFSAHPVGPSDNDDLLRILSHESEVGFFRKVLIGPLKMKDQEGSAIIKLSRACYHFLALGDLEETAAAQLKQGAIGIFREFVRTGYIPLSRLFSVHEASFPALTECRIKALKHLAAKGKDMSQLALSVAEALIDRNAEVGGITLTPEDFEKFFECGLPLDYRYLFGWAWLELTLDTRQDLAVFFYRKGLRLCKVKMSGGLCYKLEIVKSLVRKIATENCMIEFLLIHAGLLDPNSPFSWLPREIAIEICTFSYGVEFLRVVQDLFNMQPKP